MSSQSKHPCEISSLKSTCGLLNSSGSGAAKDQQRCGETSTPRRCGVVHIVSGQSHCWWPGGMAGTLPRGMAGGCSGYPWLSRTEAACAFLQSCAECSMGICLVSPQAGNFFPFQPPILFFFSPRRSVLTARLREEEYFLCRANCHVQICNVIQLCGIAVFWRNSSTGAAH